MPSCSFKLCNLHLTAGTISVPDWGRLDGGRGPQWREDRKSPSHPPKSKSMVKKKKKSVLNALREKEGAERPLRWKGEGWWFLLIQRKARETGGGTDARGSTVQTIYAPVQRCLGRLNLPEGREGPRPSWLVGLLPKTHCSSLLIGRASRPLLACSQRKSVSPEFEPHLSLLPAV